MLKVDLGHEHLFIFAAFYYLPMLMFTIVVGF